MIATRARLGTISASSAICLALSSGTCVDNPVTLPPGRARLATTPEPTGSLSCPMTMGISLVAFIAGRVADEPPETITLAGNATSSAASAGMRARTPFA